MKVTFSKQKQFSKEQLAALYNDVGWFAYTQDLPQLQQAIEQSLYVVGAYKGEELVGLVRVVGDGLTIIYVQDILVKEAEQNQGIASHLLEDVLHTFASVRQKVLLTEEAPDVRHFYEKHGFTSCDQGETVTFAKFT